MLLALAIAMNCRTFQFFPGMPLIQEAWYGCCLLLLITLVPYWKWKKCFRFSGLESYLILLMLILPGISAYCAWRAVGQPLSYGLAAERSVGLFAFIIAICYALQRKRLKVGDFEKSLLLLAWGTLIIYTAMRLWLRPSHFTEYGIGFVTGLDDLAEFKLQPFFTVFGFFYYLFQGFRTRSAKNYAISLLFFASSIGTTGGRSLTISMVLASMLLFFRWGGAVFLWKTLPKMLLAIAALLGILYVSSSEAVSARYAKFSDAFQALAGVDVEDPSAAARPLQVLTALPRIADRPVFGNGLASNQWQRAEENSLGDFFPVDYFFPPDIGVIGVLYLYGVFGILLFAWQYRFAFAALSNLPGSYHTPLLDSVKGFLVFSAFNSITTGIFAFNAESILLFIVLLMSIVSDFQGRASTLLARGHRPAIWSETP
jgi:hypothetical protein